MMHKDIAEVVDCVNGWKASSSVVLCPIPMSY